jgi:hypothetical protein
MQRKFLTLKKPAASETLILIDNCEYLSVEKNKRGSGTSMLNIEPIQIPPLALPYIYADCIFRCSPLLPFLIIIIQL